MAGGCVATGWVATGWVAGGCVATTTVVSAGMLVDDSATSTDGVVVEASDDLVDWLLHAEALTAASTRASV